MIGSEVSTLLGPAGAVSAEPGEEAGVVQPETPRFQAAWQSSSAPSGEQQAELSEIADAGLNSDQTANLEQRVQWAGGSQPAAYLDGAIGDYQQADALEQANPTNKSLQSTLQADVATAEQTGNYSALESDISYFTNNAAAGGTGAGTAVGSGAYGGSGAGAAGTYGGSGAGAAGTYGGSGSGAAGTYGGGAGSGASGAYSGSGSSGATALSGEQQAELGAISNAGLNTDQASSLESQVLTGGSQQAGTMYQEIGDFKQADNLELQNPTNQTLQSTLQSDIATAEQTGNTSKLESDIANFNNNPGTPSASEPPSTLDKGQIPGVVNDTTVLQPKIVIH